MWLLLTLALETVKCETGTPDWPRFPKLKTVRVDGRAGVAFAAPRTLLQLQQLEQQLLRQQH